MTESLQALIGSAVREPQATRIQYRDSIAAYGSEAIDAVSPWLADPDLCRFALRVIWKAGELDAREHAVKVLLEAWGDPTAKVSRDDLDLHLRKLGHNPPQSTTPRDPFRPGRIPEDAGKGWPGFQAHEFGFVEGTRWRSREGETSLIPLLLRPLRHQHPGFDSWPIYHSPEVHLASRSRYVLPGDWDQGWRASKLVAYAHGHTPERPDAPPIVTAAYYVEKGGSPDKPWVPDDRWDWPLFLDILRTPHVQLELGSAMARHELRIGDYVGGNRFGAGKATVGFVGRLEEGLLVLRSPEGVEVARGWDGLLAHLASLPNQQWHDLHVWRSWPAEEAIDGGPSFAGDTLVPVLADLARVYLDVIQRAKKW